MDNTNLGVASSVSGEVIENIETNIRWMDKNFDSITQWLDKNKLL